MSQAVPSGYGLRENKIGLIIDENFINQVEVIPSQDRIKPALI